MAEIINTQWPELTDRSIITPDHLEHVRAGLLNQLDPATLAAERIFDSQLRSSGASIGHSSEALMQDASRLGNSSDALMQDASRLGHAVLEGDKVTFDRIYKKYGDQGQGIDDLVDTVNRGLANSGIVVEHHVIVPFSGPNVASYLEICDPRGGLRVFDERKAGWSVYDPGHKVTSVDDALGSLRSAAVTGLNKAAKQSNELRF